jgi:hypothetical protein
VGWGGWGGCMGGDKILGGEYERGLCYVCMCIVWYGVWRFVIHGIEEVESSSMNM